MLRVVVGLDVAQSAAVLASVPVRTGGDDAGLRRLAEVLEAERVADGERGGRAPVVREVTE